MRITYPYLKDDAFLKAVYSQHVSEYYAKITVLDWQENPIQDIQGKVITGNISISGDSNVRRTADLTIVADGVVNDFTKVDSLLSINKKISLQLGIVNSVNLISEFPRYEKYDILWFPLGVYVIISPSITHDASNITIGLSLEDKMALLNGDVGGVISASTTLDEYETIDNNGVIYLTRPTIYQIIQELVNHFGGEQLSKIIISDLDPYVKQVMKWTANSPLYVVKAKENAEDVIYTTSTNRYDELIASGYIDVEGSPFESGYDVGYIYTDFTYPGELIADAGDSVCDILDQIKDTLGNFEYFYNIDGDFVFQEVKNYLNNSQAKTIISQLRNNSDISSNSYLLDISKGKAVWKFDDSNLINSYSNAPQYGMIKNDFVIWGLRETTDGNSYPVRYHLAIDKKPKTGHTYKCFAYEDPDDGITKYHVPSEYTNKDNFPKQGAEQQFYLDLSTKKIYTWGYDQKADAYTYIDTGAEMLEITTTDWRTELYFQGISAEPYGVSSNYYFTELKNEWPKIYDIQNGRFKDDTLHSPTSIDFFLDFIDSSASIGQFSVNNIGRRSYVVSDDKVNCVFEPEIPDVILIQNNTQSELAKNKMYQECVAEDQAFALIDSNVYSMLATGGTLNSAYQNVRQLLHQYTSYNESIQISCLPIYHLEPNTRINVYDSDSNIHGDYIINSISYSFDTQSLMTISATRALERI